MLKEFGPPFLLSAFHTTYEYCLPSKSCKSSTPFPKSVWTRTSFLDRPFWQSSSLGRLEASRSDRITISSMLLRVAIDQETPSKRLGQRSRRIIRKEGEQYLSRERTPLTPREGRKPPPPLRNNAHSAKGTQLITPMSHLLAQVFNQPSNIGRQSVKLWLLP